jgi:hypothetical protein
LKLTDEWRSIKMELEFQVIFVLGWSGMMVAETITFTELDHPRSLSTCRLAFGWLFYIALLVNLLWHFFYARRFPKAKWDMNLRTLEEVPAPQLNSPVYAPLV